jgi:hypothetical protein
MSTIQREMTASCGFASEGRITGSLNLSNITHTDDDGLSFFVTYRKMSVCSTETYTI